MNDYYVATANVPPADTRSAPEIYTQVEFAKVALGFDKFPAISAADRFRQVQVNAAADGLSLGPSTQERVETGFFPAREGLPGGMPTLNGYRFDANEFYRVDGFIPFYVEPGGAARQIFISLKFPEQHASASGISMSGTRDNTLAFRNWTRDAFTVAVSTFQSYDPGEQVSLDFRGIVKAGPVTSTMNVQSTSDGIGEILVLAGAWVKVTRLS